MSLCFETKKIAVILIHNMIIWFVVQIFCIRVDMIKRKLQMQFTCLLEHGKVDWPSATDSHGNNGFISSLKLGLGLKLYISQKAILKIESARINFFLRPSIPKI